MTKIDKILGENIVKRREMLGMTRQQLADATKLSLSGLQRIEKARRWPRTAESIETIAKALGVQPWALFMPIER